MRKKAGAHTNFTAEEIIHIRAAGDRGEDVYELADLYNVAPSTIRKIWRRETFRNIGSPGGRVMERRAEVRRDPLYVEPTEEEIQASLLKLGQLLKEQGSGDALLRELEGNPPNTNEQPNEPLDPRLEKLKDDPFANVEAAKKYI
jgi:hypothetical protein